MSVAETIRSIGVQGLKFLGAKTLAAAAASYGADAEDQETISALYDRLTEQEKSALLRLIVSIAGKAVEKDRGDPRR